MKTHRISASTRCRFGYIIALLLCVAWAGLTAPIYSQERQEVLKIYSAEKWDYFLKAKDFLAEKVLELIDRLKYIGELETPFVRDQTENTFIWARGVKVMQDQPLDASDENSVVRFKNSYRDFGVCSPAMDNAIFSTVFVRGYGSFANVYPLPQTDDPWFFSSLWRGVSLRDRKWREEALIKKD